jgi:hypothetical protein
VGRKPIEINVALLFQMWNDPALSLRDIAQKLGVNDTAMHPIRHRYGLGKRPITRAAQSRKRDPSIEEIYAMAAELRAKRPQQCAG